PGASESTSAARRVGVNARDFTPGRGSLESSEVRGGGGGGVAASSLSSCRAREEGGRALTASSARRYGRVMISHVRLLVSISPIALLACASAPPAQPVAPASATPGPAMSDPSASSHGAAESTSQSSAALSTAPAKDDDAPVDDPREVNGAITMAPQLS